MNLDAFHEHFKVTSDLKTAAADAAKVYGPEFHFIIESLGGKTFNGGFYRVLKGDEIAAAASMLARAFPKLPGRFVPFGYDWLGRYFALNIQWKSAQDGGQLGLFDLGSAEVLDIPTTVVDFHNNELVEYGEDEEDSELYQGWKSQNPSEIPRDECASYKVPIFMGGKEEVDNLELCDLDVYTDFCTQLIERLGR